MARPPKRQGTETFEVTVPDALYSALVHLATHTPLGFTENAVAAYILAKEIERMQQTKQTNRKLARTAKERTPGLLPAQTQKPQSVSGPGL